MYEMYDVFFINLRTLTSAMDFDKLNQYFVNMCKLVLEHVNKVKK